MIKINNLEHEQQLHTKIQPTLFSKLKYAYKYVGLDKAAILLLLLKIEQKHFVKKGKTEQEKKIRREILCRINKVYKNIPCLHYPMHYLMIADFILNLDVEGDIVECGSYKGGSSAQLSIIAKQTGRKLYVCDSFLGLPMPNKDESTVHIFNSNRKHTFKVGDYQATLPEVKDNIRKYGEIDVCEFVEGFYSDSLPNLNVNPAVISLDVDLISSARECLQYLYPQLKKGGYVFTHEAEVKTYMEGIMDKTWWNKYLDECPPLVYGAGSSLSPLAEGLAMFQK